MSGSRLYALCVGVASYRRLRQLACPGVDALDVAEVLQRGALPADVMRLVDGAATKRAIAGGLAWLAEQAGPADTALVYLSGHGGRELEAEEAPAYFCPVEAAPAALAQTCISSAELTTALRGIHAGRLMVILDTCFAGGIGEPRQAGARLVTGLDGAVATRLVEGRGRFILAASRPDELAWELNGMRNGLFTSYLLRGLRGEAARPDGTIWASDLFGYVSRGVRAHGRQHPFQKAIGEDFVVVVRGAAVGPSAVAAADRRLRLELRQAYNRAELSLLCHDLGLSLEDLPGPTLETQLMDLIDHARRHGLYEQLVEHVRIDRPQLYVGV